ncbi:MAG: ATP-binding protein, partial [Sphaerochaetaceae bacterium]
NGSRSVDMNKYFDPFFTTKIHGSGIGLSISRQFVKARGGSITLTMREGGGTRAEVVLKLVPEKFVRVILDTESESGRVNR